MTLKKTTVYFSEPGAKNTEDVIQTVVERIKEGDIKIVVVASTTGETGLKFTNALKGLVDTIVISHRTITPKNKTEVEKLGGKAVDGTHIALEELDHVKKSFYTLGQGFKVVVEVILIAADKGLIPIGNDVVGVGGTGKGSDTAIITRATKTKDIFSEDKDKKLEIREVIAMPLKKYWW